MFACIYSTAHECVCECGGEYVCVCECVIEDALFES